MSELNNEPAIRKNDLATASSPSAMFTTILLLIAGLLLTSSMLIHYGTRTTDENGESISSLTHLLEMAKRNSAGILRGSKTDASTIRPAAPSSNTQNTADKSSGFSLRKLFGKEGKTRWPHLKLNGFGHLSKNKSGFAIINGKHLLEGDTIKGVTLVEVLDQEGVLVEYKGETKTLIIELAD